MIVFDCENCGRSITVTDDEAGENRNCENCGVVLTVPSVSRDLPALTQSDMPVPDTTPVPQFATEPAETSRSPRPTLWIVLGVVALIAVAVGAFLWLNID